MSFAGEGDDTVIGGDGNDTILGEGGSDTLHGGNGDNTLYGGDGDDEMLGGAGTDVIYGEGDADLILGGTCEDLLDGGAGDDRIFGEFGLDVLVGGAGADFLHGGEDGDRLTGGGGNDDFAWNSLDQSLLGKVGAYSFDTITDYYQGDRLDSPFASATLTESHGTVTILSEQYIRALLNPIFTPYTACAFQAFGWNGTFVAFNDNVAGFQASSDGIVFLENYNLITANYPISLA